MDDDSTLLRDLARASREEEAVERQRWERWERLTGGVLSPGEEAELLALKTSSAEGEAAFEAFSPLKPDFRARMVALIEPQVRPRPIPPPPEPLPLPPPPGRSSWWLAGVLGSGLAASALAVWLAWDSVRTPPSEPTVEVALEYKVQKVRPGEAVARGDDGVAEPTQLAAGGKFYTSARPGSALSVEIEPQCYVKPKPAPERLRTAECIATKQEKGAVEIAGSLPEELPAGPATLWVVLAVSGHQPSAAQVAQMPQDRPTSTKSWFAGPQPVEILAP